jgi:excisionase family DNA binding protein
MEDLLDLVATAKMLHLSRSRTYQKAVDGELPSLQVNGRGKLLFRREDLLAALKPKSSKQTHVNA